MKAVNILYIAPSTGIGGVETFLKNCSEAHSPAFKPVYLLFKHGPLGDDLEQKHAKVYYCITPPRLSRPWTWIMYWRLLFLILHREEIDIVHSSMAYAALFTWPAFLKSKHIWFQHGPVSGWMDKWAHWLPSAAVLYNSEHSLMEQMHISKTSPDSSKDLVFPLGTKKYDVSNADRLRILFREKYNLPLNTCIMIMACRLQRWKGVHFAIEAYKNIPTSKTPSAFFIFGDKSWDPTYQQELQELAKGYSIFFEEPVADIAPIFMSSDIVINASETPEPFGLTLIEAMSCKALPIAAKSGGPKEILIDLPECMFIHRDKNSLTQILSFLMEHEQTLNTLKNKAYSIYLKKYTIEHMIVRLETIYKKLLNLNE